MLIFVLVCVVGLVMVMITYAADAHFNRNRIVSDEEFLAAIPDCNPETALKIRAIVSDQLDVPLNYLHPDDRFIEDLKCC